MLVNDAHDPLRPVNWRWREALGLACHPIVESGPEDDWISLAASTLRATANRRESLPALRGRTESITAAIQLHEAGGLTCAVLQARLLAGESDEIIAAKLGIAPKTVEAYEALHFSVRSRLAARDWIAGKVLGLYPWFAASRADRMNLMRIFGYFAGPMLVDMWAVFFAGASLEEYGPDAEVRAALDLLVRTYQEPMENLTSTLKLLSELENLLKNARKEATNAPQTAENLPPVACSDAVQAEIQIAMDIEETAQAQETATDAA